MEHCVFHPNRAAVEHCEVCNRALCGHCLWYTEDGHRLCEIHAQEREAAGETVLPPETYAEAINTQLVARQSPEKPRQPKSSTDKDDIPYKGNSQDLMALLAAVMAGTVLFSCFGGLYCLPIVAFLLGIVGFLNASKAVDPQRTRLLSSVSLGVGGLMLMGILAYFAFFFMFIAFSFITASSGP
ncbi:MAG: hypothetical protein WAM60_10875 [Candidatus Promineifilaceae bacterium]